MSGRLTMLTTFISKFIFAYKDKQCNCNSLVLVFQRLDVKESSSRTLPPLPPPHPAGHSAPVSVAKRHSWTRGTSPAFFNAHVCPSNWRMRKASLPSPTFIRLTSHTPIGVHGKVKQEPRRPVTALLRQAGRNEPDARGRVGGGARRGGGLLDRLQVLQCQPVECLQKRILSCVVGRWWRWWWWGLQLNFWNRSWTPATNPRNARIPVREKSPRVIDGEAALLADLQHICKFRPGMTSHHGKISRLSRPAQLQRADQPAVQSV